MEDSCFGGREAPLFSVLMPAYNHEEYVAEALESVLGQSFRDLEVIVIDDASRDGTPRIVADFAARDPRVRAYFHRKNIGISKTLNEALDLARGRFVAVINSDDRWKKEKLCRQWEVLQEDEDLVVWTEGALIDAGGRPLNMTFTEIYRASEKPKSGDLLEALCDENYILHSSLAVKKETAARFGYDVALRYNNDHRLFIELASCCRYYFLPEQLVEYRLHGNNAISRDEETWENDYRLLYRHVLENYGHRLGRSTRKRIYRILGSLYDKAGMGSNAMRMLYHAVSLDPEDMALRFKCLNVGDGMLRGEFVWCMRPWRICPRGAKRYAGNCGEDAGKQAEALFVGALRYGAEGRLEKARDAYKEAIRKMERLPGAWNNLGIVFSLMNRTEDAMHCFNSALFLDGALAHGWYNRGVILCREGDLAGAVVDFEKAAELAKMEAGQGRGEQYAAELAVLALNNLGICLAVTEGVDSALVCLEDATRFRPQCARSRYNLGYLLEYGGYAREAFKEYGRALEIDPQLRRARLRKALCAASLGSWDEALSELGQLIEGCPGDGDAWMEKGTCYVALGKTKKALRCFERALQCEPGNAEAWQRKAALLAAEGKRLEAISCYREVLAYDPEDKDCRLEAGRLLLQEGNPEEASEEFGRLLDYDPDCAVAWFGLGLANASMGELEKAAECLDRALELDPCYMEAREARTEVALAIANFTENLVPGALLGGTRGRAKTCRGEAVG